MGLSSNHEKLGKKSIDSYTETDAESCFSLLSLTLKYMYAYYAITRFCDSLDSGISSCGRKHKPFFPCFNSGDCYLYL